MTAAVLQIGTWLALSTWFGAAVFMAAAVPVILRIIRDADPTLPTVLSVNLDGEHSSLLAGSLIAALTQTLIRIELICGGGLAILLAAEAIAMLVGGNASGWLNFAVRAILFIAAASLVVYDWRVIRPRQDAARLRYIDQADDPEAADAARADFDAYSREGVVVLTGLLFVLLGLVAFTASATAAGTMQYTFS